MRHFQQKFDNIPIIAIVNKFGGEVSIGGMGDDILAMVAGSGSKVEFSIVLSVSSISVTTIAVNSLLSVDEFVDSGKLVAFQLSVVIRISSISSSLLLNFLTLSLFSDKKSTIRGKFGGGGGSGGGW